MITSPLKLDTDSFKLSLMDHRTNFCLLLSREGNWHCHTWANGKCQFTSIEWTEKVLPELNSNGIIGCIHANLLLPRAGHMSFGLADAKDWCCRQDFSIKICVPYCVHGRPKIIKSSINSSSAVLMTSFGVRLVTFPANMARVLSEDRHSHHLISIGHQKLLYSWQSSMLSRCQL